MAKQGTSSSTKCRPESREGSAGFVGGYATQRVDYSHDLIANEACQFIENNQAGPFFLYLALTIPHANNEATSAKQNGQEVPDFGFYKDLPWSDQDKGLAAMISRMDGDVGRILKLLLNLGIDERTVVMFSSDNGPHHEGGQDPQRFASSGPLRGMKRDLYEGGIRVPLIVRWPGTTPIAQVTDHVAYFGDFMATAGDLAGAQIPTGLDSISFYPTITGQSSSQQAADHLYWEFYEQGSRQAVRAGQWKAIREPMFNGDTQLYDVTIDQKEKTDVSEKNQEIVKKLEQLMDQEHTPHPNWKVKCNWAWPCGTACLQAVWPNEQSPWHCSIHACSHDNASTCPGSPTRDKPLEQWAVSTLRAQSGDLLEHGRFCYRPCGTCVNTQCHTYCSIHARSHRDASSRLSSGQCPHCVHKVAIVEHGRFCYRPVARVTPVPH